MGNCQAIDAATLVIRHPSGKIDHMYWPITASHVMKMNPGYHVALLTTTTTTTTTTTNSSQKNSKNKGSESKNTGTGSSRNSVRITRVKLLRPTDTLALGHVYRLVSTQEVMKGLVAKKQAKMRKKGVELEDSEGLKEAEILARRSQSDKTHQVRRHGHKSRTTPTPNGGTGRPRTWQPSLHSISEAGS